MSSTPEPYLRTAKSLIGRRDELDAVMSAINSDDDLSITLIEGQGGIGKTRLLMEIHALCKELPMLLCSEVIDLYLSRYQQPGRIMQAIAQQLQEAAAAQGIRGVLFAAYTSALNSFAARGESSEEERIRLEDAFLDDYRRLVGRYRLVLLIDTLEKLHPTISDSEPFDFHRVGRLESWLAHLLTQLPNTVTILAGRPRERQRGLFAEVLTSHFHTLSIQPFTLAETEAYVRMQFPSIADQISIGSLHTISSGRPVVLAIALACMQYDAFDGGLPPDFEQHYPQNRESLSEAFVRHIMSDLQLHQPGLAQLIKKAVYLRKGLSAGLLEQIAHDERGDDDRAVIMADIATLAGLVFVKQIDEGEVILHDEMYDLLLGKVGEEQSVEWWRSALIYLDKEIAVTRKESNLHVASNTQESWLSSVRSRQKIQNLQIERLFYQMSIDPAQGYYDYRIIISTVIAVRDDDFDAQLQEELARFFDLETKWGQRYRQRLFDKGISWERMIYDEGVRWVYRRINASGASPYAEAIKLAHTLRDRYAAIDSQSALARCDLDAARLQAEVYAGTLNVEDYARLIADLEQIIAQADPNEARYARFILANAYNYWGYFDRTHERLDSACTKYSQAIRFFRELGPEFASLRAVTLNNYGYALARQGDSDEGLVWINEALHIAQKAGARYRVATALNTRAHLLMDVSNISEALRSMQEARRIFDEIKNTRDLALNSNAEGRIRSRIAMDMQTLNPAERDQEFQRAIAAYQTAIKLFDSGGEAIRCIETRLHLSKVYRDWASRQPGGGDGQEQRDIALSLLQEAQDLVTTNQKTPRVIRCSILEAMAVIFVDQRQYDLALPLLDQARDLLPSNLRTVEALVETDETKEMRLYWLRLAQIELQYALCAFGQQRNDAAIAHSLRAIGSLVTFSLQSHGTLDRFRKLIRKAISEIGDGAEIQRLCTVNEQEALRLKVEPSTKQTLDKLLTRAIQDINLSGV